MAINFSDSSSYRILSLTQGNLPVGVKFELPGFQNVCVNAPVQQWVIRKASDTTYLLSVSGYPSTGVDETNVVASTNPGQNEEWQITYSVSQNAYTIARATQPMFGWTVPNSPADDDIVMNSPHSMW
ncbi:hypothetical protein J3R82DRAFT_9155 [Butyriboletus roseoflavus]|nr:hypothetical protein J3R82DRAFT_9155 [Butyriboletus roseoflavus]